MAVATHAWPTRALLKVYGLARRSGLLETRLCRAAFLRAYFFYKRHYEDPFHALTKRRPELFRDGHVLDVGANVGYTALTFARALSAGYHVYAFEPEAENFRRLEQTTRVHRLGDKVVAVQAAVGDRAATVELWVNEKHHADHRVVTPEFQAGHQNSAPVQRVALVTIDEFVASRGVDAPIAFVKIDVQGFELPVLRGMTKTLRAHPRLVVALEHSPADAAALGLDAEAALELLRAEGFALSLLQRNGDLKPVGAAELAAATGARGYVDVLASRARISAGAEARR